MKVEKCPRCKKTPFAEFVKTRPVGRKWKMRQACYCTKCLMSASRTFTAFKLLSELKWNRWARREAKRIKEGATK